MFVKLRCLACSRLPAARHSRLGQLRKARCQVESLLGANAVGDREARATEEAPRDARQRTPSQSRRSTATMLKTLMTPPSCPNGTEANFKQTRTLTPRGDGCLRVKRLL